MEYINSFDLWNSVIDGAFYAFLIGGLLGFILIIISFFKGSETFQVWQYIIFPFIAFLMLGVSAGFLVGLSIFLILGIPKFLIALPKVLSLGATNLFTFISNAFRWTKESFSHLFTWIKESPGIVFNSITEPIGNIFRSMTEPVGNVVNFITDPAAIATFIFHWLLVISACVIAIVFAINLLSLPFLLTAKFMMGEKTPEWIDKYIHNAVKTTWITLSISALASLGFLIYSYANVTGLPLLSP